MVFKGGHGTPDTSNEPDGRIGSNKIAKARRAETFKIHRCTLSKRLNNRPSNSTSRALHHTKHVPWKRHPRLALDSPKHLHERLESNLFVIRLELQTRHHLLEAPAHRQIGSYFLNSIAVGPCDGGHSPLFPGSHDFFQCFFGRTLVSEKIYPTSREHLPSLLHKYMSCSPGTMRQFDLVSNTHYEHNARGRRTDTR